MEPESLHLLHCQLLMVTLIRTQNDCVRTPSPPCDAGTWQISPNARMFPLPRPHTKCIDIWPAMSDTHAAAANGNDANGNDTDEQIGMREVLDVRIVVEL